MSQQTTPETKKVSTVLEKSARALTAAEQSFAKVGTELQAGVAALTAQLNGLAQDIEFKGRELQEVTATIEAAARDAKIELDFRVRENEDKVRIELVRKAGLVTTTQTELNELAESAQAATVQLQKGEFAAVKAATDRIHAEYKATLNAVESGHKVEMAELNANAKSDATTIQLLKGHIASLEATITANREAEIKKAEAASNAQGVTVNTGK